MGVTQEVKSDVLWWHVETNSWHTVETQLFITERLLLAPSSSVPLGNWTKSFPQRTRSPIKNQFFCTQKIITVAKNNEALSCNTAGAAEFEVRCCCGGCDVCVSFCVRS